MEDRSAADMFHVVIRIPRYRRNTHLPFSNSFLPLLFPFAPFFLSFFFLLQSIPPKRQCAGDLPIFSIDAQFSMLTIAPTRKSHREITGLLLTKQAKDDSGQALQKCFISDSSSQLEPSPLLQTLSELFG